MNLRMVAWLVPGVLIASPAFAQLQGIGQGQGLQNQQQQRVQQQIQARAQQRVQTQVQAQVQAQVQTQVQQRIQAEAERAARVAAKTSAMALRAAAETRRAAASTNADVRTEASVEAQSRIASRRAAAEANARIGIDASLELPPGMTAADVEAYDNIFGRHNPLRRRPQRTDDTADAGSDSDANTERTDRRPLSVEVSNGFELATRIRTAARLRRAEISAIRDEALEDGNARMLHTADEMEQRLNAFAEAQARFKAEVESALEDRQATLPRGPRFNGQTNVDVNVDISGNANSGTPSPQFGDEPTQPTTDSSAPTEPTQTTEPAPAPSTDPAN